MKENLKEIIPVCSVCYIPNWLKNSPNGVKALKIKAIYYQEGKEPTIEGMKK